MDVKDYRKSVEEKVATARRAASESAPPGVAWFLAPRGAQTGSVPGRMLGKRRFATSVPELLLVVGDAGRSGAVRTAALQKLQSAAFLATSFAPFKAEFTACLRKLAKDADEELRLEALTILAYEKDAEAQAILTGALDDPRNAPVPPATALRLLGADDHSLGVHYARKLMDRVGDPSARIEAVRILAGDPESTVLLEGLLKDRSESPELRAVSAGALQFADPGRFESLAQEIVSDHTEDPNLRATCLGALTYNKNYAASLESPGFVGTVTTLADTTPDDIEATAHHNLQSVARRFVSAAAEVEQKPDASDLAPAVRF